MIIISLNKRIKEGVLNKEHVEPPQVYVFIGEIHTKHPKERSDTFTMGGRVSNNFLNQIQANQHPNLLQKGLRFHQLSLFRQLLERFSLLAHQVSYLFALIPDLSP